MSCPEDKAPGVDENITAKDGQSVEQKKIASAGVTRRGFGKILGVGAVGAIAALGHALSGCLLPKYERFKGLGDAGTPSRQPTSQPASQPASAPSGKLQQPASNKAPSSAPAQQPSTDKAPTGIVLSEVKKRVLRDNPGSLYDEESGEVLCGANKKTVGAKRDKVTMDGIIFEVRRKKDVTPDEKIVEVTFGNTTVKLRKAFADLLLKVQEDMKSDYELYKSGKGSIWFKAGYYKNVILLGGNGPMDYISVAEGLRSTERQDELYKSSRATVQNGKRKQGFRVSPPGYSFHQTGYAVDVNNWERVQIYMWKYLIMGGSRGLDKDPRHFSIKEFSNKGLIRGAANRIWVWGQRRKRKKNKR
jgi:hypothetical protein